jgi:hypothetical protein
VSDIARDPDQDLRDNEIEQSQLAALLLRLWQTPSGWLGSLTSVDHKVIGKRYILTAFAFLILGGLLAVLMRIQLAGAERKLMSPDLYNQVFTVHGSTMMFLFAVPVMEAFAVYFVPLMVGTRNIAFPRLNAFSYWIFLFGGCFLWIAFLINVGPDVGWFAYVPLSNLQYSPSKRADVWAQMITFTEVAALAVAVEIVVTVFKQRAVGMTLDRIPIFVWAMLVTSFLVLFAMPSIMVASTTLILDRLVNTHFYDTASGGNVLLWQHLFWFFGHPEVYIIFIPGTGMVLYRHCSLADRYWLLVVRSVGAPHVRDGPAATRGQHVYGIQHVDRSSERVADLLLACNALGRPSRLSHAAIVRARLLREFCLGRPLRRHGRISADRYAGA